MRSKRTRFCYTVAALLCLSSAITAAQTPKVDPALPAYTKTGSLSGNLGSIGSDTLNNLMTLWAEAFRKTYPSVNVQIEGKGSSTAPPALIEGTAQLGPMSRKMKSEEIDKFEGKFGYPPTRIGVALDALAVYVHKDNPIESLSFPQIDAAFSKTRIGGHPKDVRTWGQLGVTGSLAAEPISLYGRNSASGTYAFFKSNALFKGDYKDTVKEQPGSASVVQGITNDTAAMGYSGIGYITSGIRVVPLSKATGDTAYSPTQDNVMSGKYPLGRMLYVYVAREPGKPMDKLTREFLKLVLSKEGQEIVVKDGYLPLPARLAGTQAGMLE